MAFKQGVFLHRFLRGLPKCHNVQAEGEVAFSVASILDSVSKSVPPEKFDQKLEAVRPMINAELESRLSNLELKAKHHPGLRSREIITLPEEVQSAVFSLIGKYKLEDLKNASIQFAHQLKSRLPPADNQELRIKAADLEEKLRSKYQLSAENVSPEEVTMNEEKIKQKLYAKLRKLFYHWKPIEYDAYHCLLYLYSRFPAEYAVLCKVFEEIKARDADFKPEYFLDVGSGLCSALWASRYVWKDGIRVALCVDHSPDMHKIAKLLMQGGKASGKSAFQGVFFKPIIPYGEENKYDIVTCAYSLMEIENQEQRFKLYDSMLSSSRKYIAIVEHATSGGFKLIMEARDYILSKNFARIVAPCPHQKACPRLSSQELNSICSFDTKFNGLRLVTQKQTVSCEQYSYLVFEKSSAEVRNSSSDIWPRVLNAAPRARHVHLHTCCPDGSIRQLPITKNKNGQHMYKCASYCKKGDLLPCTLQKKNVETK